jgi:hypothetical protein
MGLSGDIRRAWLVLESSRLMPNKCIKPVCVAHSTRNSLRALLALEGAKSDDATSVEDGGFTNV